MLNDIGELVLLMMGRYVSTSWLAVADRFPNLLEAKRQELYLFLSICDEG
jgi:hypothetical protein